MDDNRKTLLLLLMTTVGSDDAPWVRLELSWLCSHTHPHTECQIDVVVPSNIYFLHFPLATSPAAAWPTINSNTLAMFSNNFSPSSCSWSIFHSFPISSSTSVRAAAQCRIHPPSSQPVGASQQQPVLFGLVNYLPFEYILAPGESTLYKSLIEGCGSDLW